MSGALNAVQTEVPSVVVPPSVVPYVGAVAAVVPAVEHLYQNPVGVGGFLNIAVVYAVLLATETTAAIAVAIPLKFVSVPD